MVTIEHDGLVLCHTCACLIANGEAFDSSGDISEEHAAKMVAHMARNLGGLVLACGNCHCDESVSKSECDGCGDTAEGWRHPAAILGKVEG